MKKNGIIGVGFVAFVVLSLSVLTFGQPIDLCDSTFRFNLSKTAVLRTSSTSNSALSPDFVEALKDHSSSQIQLIPDRMLQKMVPSCISGLEIGNFNLKVSSTPAGDKTETSETNQTNPLGFVLR